MCAARCIRNKYNSTSIFPSQYLPKYIEYLSQKLLFQFVKPPNDSVLRCFT